MPPTTPPTMAPVDEAAGEALLLLLLGLVAGAASPAGTPGVGALLDVTVETGVESAEGVTAGVEEEEAPGGKLVVGAGVPAGVWDDDGWLELVRIEPEQEPPKAVGLLDEGLETTPQELDAAHQPQFEYCRHCACVGRPPLKNAQMSSVMNPKLDAAHRAVVSPSIVMHVSRVFVGRPEMPWI